MPKLNCDIAYRLEQLVAILDSHNRLIDLAKRGVQAAEMFMFVFCQLALGDVAYNAQQVAVGERAGIDLHVERFPVLTPQAMVAAMLAAVLTGGRLVRACQAGGKCLRKCLRIQILRERRIRCRQAEQLLARVAEHFTAVRVDLNILPLTIGNKDAVRRL